MAQNVWNATLEPNNNVKQNTFDWTHVNNLTTQIGRITPIQCELVPAKTSFRVKPFPALQLMPMVFPIQTRMRATISYFRYPLRALWKDFKDFEGNFREGLEEPYHDFNSQTLLDKMLQTGQLMDYLGVPTTIVGDYGSDYPMDLSIPFLAGPSLSASTTQSDLNTFLSQTPNINAWLVSPETGRLYWASQSIRFPASYTYPTDSPTSVVKFRFDSAFQSSVSIQMFVLAAYDGKGMFIKSVLPSSVSNGVVTFPLTFDSSQNCRSLV